MTDRPILFSAPMVRALLEGRKTQTRRILKPDWFEGASPTFTGWVPERVGVTSWVLKCTDIGAGLTVPYAPGDRLWVREAFNQFWFSQDGEDAWPADKIVDSAEVRRIADEGARVSPPQMVYRESDRAREWFSDQRWRPSMFMPRWASRLTLIVTDVRVQRLRDISKDDAVAEGLIKVPHAPPLAREMNVDWGFDGDTRYGSPVSAFACLWDSLNAKRGYGWETNPWVCAVTFTVHQCNIDQMEAT